MTQRFLSGAFARAAVLLSFLLAAAPVHAQHEHHQPPPAQPSPEKPAQEPQAKTGQKPPEHEHGEPAGHQMQGMEGMEGMEDMEMHALLGSYAMTREASGTSWQPESAPHSGLHRMAGTWELMAHGYATGVYDDQGGPRGDTKSFSENMVMGMANRPLSAGRLGLRAMISAEPWTIGRGGYPLLLQTGETANGIDPLIDHQHPHDLFMELAATWSRPIGADGSVFVYLGLPGEPALGPPAFMHRFSGLENPEAPLGHHWLDSTHITYGVATLGWVRGPLKLESSVFTGREPDENRTNIEDPQMDSWSARLSFNPTKDWAFQASYGRLHSPEQLEPDVDTARTTLSAIYNRPLAEGNWQTTLAWGRNAKDPGHTTGAWLVESAVSHRRTTLFGRAERQENDELFPDDARAGHVFTIGKLTLGGIQDVMAKQSWKLGIGALGSVAFTPDEIRDAYGHQPLSWMGILRLKV